jgi:RNA polymerase sigma factor (sigma-70 family)
MTSQESPTDTPIEPKQEQLSVLLGYDSDDSFGLPDLQEHLTQDEFPVILRDWTAKDFASVYVRFKPHLERHAWRFLNNQTQVEEVVQDAFLYLMTALPELDSELGVLRFLKWKTRMLALDVIRVNSRRTIIPILDEDFPSRDSEISQGLERADDAAIVSLALAKLTPRHREILIASVYQEKSTEDISSDLGISENATRQLLFRARSAFRKALVGEAETEGLSTGQILGLAARKARAEAGKLMTAVGAFLLVVGSIISLNGISPTPVQNASEKPPLPITVTEEDGGAESNSSNVINPDVTSLEDQTGVPDAVLAEGIQNDGRLPSDSTDVGESPSKVGANKPSDFEPVPSSTPTLETTKDTYDIEFGRAALSEIDLVSFGAIQTDSSIPPVTIYMTDFDERRVNFSFDINSTEIFTDVSVELNFQGVTYRTLNIYNSEIVSDFNHGVFVFEAQIGYLIDEDRNLLEDDAINGALIRIQLNTDRDLTQILMYEVSYSPSSKSKTA